MTHALAYFHRRLCHAWPLLLSFVLVSAPGHAALAEQAYQARFGEARELARQGDLVAAAAIYQELIREAPRQPAAYNNLAAIRARQGKLEEAQNLLEQALRKHPDYAAVYENLSAVYVEMARDSYGKALRLDAPPKTVALRELKSASLSEASTVTAASAPTQPAERPAVVASVSPPTVTAVPQPAPAAPAAVQTPADPVLDKEAVITTLQGWAAAWSEQAVDVYLLFYTPDFSPPGMSRQAWLAQRRVRLQAPQWIQVELSDFEVTSIDAETAEVHLIQDYRADNYRDRTMKLLQLRQTADGWRISQEASLRRLD